MLTVSLAWLLFAGSHVAFAAERVRAPLARRLGERRFLLFYGLIANLLFALLILVYTSERSSGPTGAMLGAHPIARPILIGCLVLGVALMCASFAPKAYWRSPFMVLTGSTRAPFGLERVTRHPFFTGLVLFAGAHALLAGHLVDTIFFGGFVVLVIVGTHHQGAKLRERRGAAYRRFLEQSSALPFVAIVRGRQHLVLAEIPWLWLFLGAGLAGGFWLAHDHIFAFGGAPLAGAVAIGTVLIAVRGFRMSAKSDMT